MTKLAETAPPYCASCFQAGGDKRYIDFEAAYDGPVIPGTPEPVPVDDLILCEDCLQTAFAILDPRGERVEIERLEGQIKAQDEHQEALERQIHGMQETITELVDHPIRKHRGKRAFQVEDQDVKKLLMSQRQQRETRNKKAKVG